LSQLGLILEEGGMQMSRQKQRGWSVVAVFAGLAAACNGPTKESDLLAVATAEQPLYVASTRVWPNPNIQVCWETRGFATEKDWVRTAIRETWEKESGVVFTDWGDCDRPSPGLHIAVDDGLSKANGLGTDLDRVRPGLFLNFTFANADRGCQDPQVRKSCIRYLAIRTFGEALGFTSEQNRPDRPPTCLATPQGANGDTTVGAFDMNSIMNTCNPNRLDGKLSNTDVDGARQYYGPPLGPDQQFLVGDVDGDHRSDMIQTYRGWASIPTCKSTGAGWSCANPAASVFDWGSPEQRFLTGDFNGDLLTDTIQVNRLWSSIPRCLSTGSGWSCTNPSAVISDSGSAEQRFLTGDFNADGKTDVFQVYRKWKSILVCRGGDIGFSCLNPPAQIFDSGSPEQQFMTGDFNRDGRTDMFQVYRKWRSIPVCVATSGNFFTCSNPSATIFDSGSAEQQFLTGDFNGDRRTDVVQAYRKWQSLPRCLSTGAGWSCDNLPATIFDSGAYEQRFLTGDFNGDGLTDVAQVFRGWSSIPVCLATATGWSCTNLPANIVNSGSSEQSFVAADVNGDGLTDIVQVYRGWSSYPVCLSTGAGWSCSNAAATVVDSGKY
jgi:FG-GAP-like repeat